MKIFGKNFDDKKVKKIAYVAVCMILIGWFVFRFIMVAIENRMTVFNPLRDMAQNGVLVETIVVNKQEGIIKIPLVVKNNRAYVSPSRLGKFRVGQKIGSGKISLVGSSLDLDTGMYVIKTTGVSDGLNYAEAKFSGYFIPVYAVRNGVVMVAENDLSHVRKINVIAQDSGTACITSGLHDGDVVILSNVDENQKINIKD